MARAPDLDRINNATVEAFDFSPTLRAQRECFQSGRTRPLAFRRAQLERLGALVRDSEDEIQEALRLDLGKPAYEAYASEIGLVLADLRQATNRLASWSRSESVATPLVHFPSSSWIHREPLGVVLIIAPWNYPFQLVFAPLIGALAAGNCAVVKPSEWSSHTSKLIADLVARYFPMEVVTSVTGGVSISEALLRERFDHIFFTGSLPVGKKVALAAAEHLTPITLELGGKSPCILDEEVDLETAARRIAWGKFWNAGQTCIAPDYLLVPPRLERPLLERMIFYLREFFGEQAAQSEDYVRIINERHFDRLSRYLSPGQIVTGGETDRDRLFIAPTILTDLPEGAPALEEEIFGPILPLIRYDGLDEAITVTRRHPDPLALYFFSSNRSHQQRILEEIPFGGGCINNTLVHFANPALPFGGRGRSGYGSYHGRFGFEVFSHLKAVMKTSSAIDPGLRYPPYAGKLGWLKKLLR